MLDHLSSKAYDVRVIYDEVSKRFAANGSGNFAVLCATFSNSMQKLVMNPRILDPHSSEVYCYILYSNLKLCTFAHYIDSSCIFFLMPCHII